MIKSGTQTSVSSPSVAPTAHARAEAKGRPGRNAGQRATRLNKDTATPRQAQSRRSESADGTIGEIMHRLRSIHPASQISRYFNERTKMAVHDGTLEITVPSSFQAELIERKFGRSLRDFFAERGRADPSTLTFRIDNTPRSTPDKPSRSRKAKPIARPVIKSGRSHDQRFDLDSYVVGDANTVAYDAACKIAQQDTEPGLTRLFIHSECGLGKTHLLRGIVRRVRQHAPAARVRYIAAEAFTNEYIASIQANTVDAFRKRYRGLDLLCIDDIHFLARKNATQVELLHTFDEIDLGGARLVLASDGHPSQIETLNKGLINRFLSGMVVAIDTPEPALRQRLILELASRRGLRLGREAVALLAQDASGSSVWTVRELEGSLTRLAAAASLCQERTTSGEIPMHIVEQALHRSGIAPRPHAVRFDHICEAVCRALEIEARELGQSGRHRRVVMARAIITRLCRQLTTLSYPEIARKMGKTNHSTVITAHQRIEKQLDDTIALGLPIDGLTIAQFADRLTRRLRQPA
ncbi:MAG TPA: AAA family ATPase [Phycisphaerales bacterium]|nr:AAA family ATPase [Phycisphaerales bacterium]